MQPMFDLPGDPTVSKLVVTPGTVLEQEAPVVIREELAEAV